MAFLDVYLHSQVLAWSSGAALGVLLHLTLFIRGEWQISAPKLLVGHVGFQSCLYLLHYLRLSHDSRLILLSVQTSFIAYLVSLFASIIVYRLCFHRLGKAGFKGPFWARVSKLQHVWICRTGQNHLYLDKLYHQYGDFVRTGPAEVTVFDPKVFVAIDSPHSECIKAEFYDLLYPTKALVATREKPVHTARRKEWARGFAATEVPRHARKIAKYVNQLDTFLRADALSGNITDARNFCYWYGFDIMGDVVFNKSFDMLANKQWHHIIVQLQRAVGLLGPFSPAAWLIQLGFRMGPKVSALKDWFAMRDWCEGQMLSRMNDHKDSSKEPDLVHYLMEEKVGQEVVVSKNSWLWTRGDSLLAIIAGSDPTATSLIGCFCELAKQPDQVEKLYNELENINPQDIKALANLPHLNAVLNEAMRLYPALLSGGGRKTTTDGIWVGETYIPPETTVIAPRFTIQRREDCFEKPNDFIPERFTTKPEMVKNPAAFTPFGTGNRNCLGKNLAMDIMRVCLATVCKSYQFSLAPGDNGTRTLDESTDQFVALPGPLELKFRLR